MAASTSTLGPTIATMALDDKQFRFFDLTRELRDRIYEYCMEPLDRCFPSTAQDARGFSKGVNYLSARCFCIRSLLLVNRQFQDEYETEVFRHVELLIYPRFDTAQQILSSHARGLLRRIRSVRVVYEEHPQALDEIIKYPVRCKAAPLAALLPALSSIKVELRTTLDPEWLNESASALRPFFDQNPFVPSALTWASPKPITVATALYFKGQLYSPDRRLESNFSLYTHLLTSRRNKITYRVYPGSTANQLLGKCLGTEEAGSYDWDEAVAWAKSYRLN